MRRIDTPTAAPDLFGPGKKGFRNGDPANAILATRLQAEWFNALQEEVASFIELADIALDSMDNAQLLKAFRVHRGGAGTGFGVWAWSAGTAGDPGAGKVGLNNADPALATQILLAEASSEGADYSMVLAASQAGDTIYLQPRDSAALGHRFKVSGAAVDHGAYRAIPVAYIGGAGGLPAAGISMLVRLAQTTAADASTDGIAGSFSNLKASTTGTNATVTVTADAVCVKNSTGQQKVLTGVALAINSAAVGANGLDAGVLAANTWYSKWVIYNPATQAVAGLLSLSATAPTMPAGFTHKARTGWARTDGTANKYPLAFRQSGRLVEYFVAAGSNTTSYRQLAAGVQGSPAASPTWVAVSVSAATPPTAAAIKVMMDVPPLASQSVVAPSSAHGGWVGGASTNPPAIGAAASGSFGAMGQANILLQSTNIYYASNNSAGSLWCQGWEDNL